MIYFDIVYVEMSQVWRKIAKSRESKRRAGWQKYGVEDLEEGDMRIFGISE